MSARGERRRKDTGTIRRRRWEGPQMWEVRTPKWAGQELIARETYYHVAEKILSAWLDAHPVPTRTSHIS